jgi:nucleoside-specific outer membrane channel protein Tsx
MQRLSLLTAGALIALAGTVHAADWSDTSISARYGSSFAEPYDNNADGSRKDIKKGILALTHISGYKYGTNFFNVDMLASDHNDPAGGVDGSSGAREVYAVYRHMLDLGKVSGKELKFGPVRGVGATAGFDFNTKNDGYASKKQMLVAGPTFMLDVPGFANLSALVFRESNAPAGTARYYYKTHGALELDWGIPIGSLPLSFNGYALYIGSKGQNEFGGSTSPETHVDMTLMVDAGVMMGLPKHTVLIGLEYEYWKNKFGNPVADAGPGALAHTPMVRAEYHF